MLYPIFLFNIFHSCVVNMCSLLLIIILNKILTLYHDCGLCIVLLHACKLYIGLVSLVTNSRNKQRTTSACSVGRWMFFNKMNDLVNMCECEWTKTYMWCLTCFTYLFCLLAIYLLLFIYIYMLCSTCVLHNFGVKQQLHWIHSV